MDDSWDDSDEDMVYYVAPPKNSKQRAATPSDDESIPEGGSVGYDEPMEGAGGSSSKVFEPMEGAGGSSSKGHTKPSPKSSKGKRKTPKQVKQEEREERDERMKPFESDREYALGNIDLLCMPAQISIRDLQAILYVKYNGPHIRGEMVPMGEDGGGLFTVVDPSVRVPSHAYGLSHAYASKHGDESCVHACVRVPSHAYGLSHAYASNHGDESCFHACVRGMCERDERSYPRHMC